MGKSFLFLLTGLFIFQIAIGQNELKARLEYEEAEKAFNENKFEDAVNRLNKAQEYLGKWSAKIGYLKIVALDNLIDYSDPDNKYSKLQQTEVKQYMDYANNNQKDVDVDKFKQVYTVEEKITVLKRVDAEQEMPEYKKADQYYEEKNYQLPELDALEVIRYKMQERGMKAKDLEPIIGSKGHVSAILSGKREITLKMAQKLKNYFSIPADVFLHST